MKKRDHLLGTSVDWIPIKRTSKTYDGIQPAHNSSQRCVLLNTVHSNVCNYLPDYTVSQPVTSQYESSPLAKSHFILRTDFLLSGNYISRREIWQP